MIILWVFISILTLLVLVILTLPLLRNQNDHRPTTADYDAAVYKSQLLEIDREAARCAFSPDEAEAARTEIARRLLTAVAFSENQKKKNAPTSESSMKFIAVIIALLITVSTLTLYLELGQPSLSSNPLAGREEERAIAQAKAKAGDGMGDVIDKLKAKLVEKPDSPDSIEGWILLGRSYSTIGRLDKSLEAYEKAIALDRTYPGLLSLYGEMLVMAAQGGILEPAMAIFNEALALDSQDVRARFYLAQGDHQAGRIGQALDGYIDLANSTPADALWQPIVREAAQAIANEFDIDISKRLPEILVAVESNGPDGEDMAAAAEMSESDRQKMIESMVANLSERLKDAPENLEGWMRLGQSYMVLNRFQESIDAFDRANALSPENTQILLMKGRAMRAQNTSSAKRQARAIMTKVLALNPNNIEALWISAIDEADQGNREGARAYFDKALKLVGDESADHTELRIKADDILSKIK